MQRQWARGRDGQGPGHGTARTPRQAGGAGAGAVRRHRRARHVQTGLAPHPDSPYSGRQNWWATALPSDLTPCRLSSALACFHHLEARVRLAARVSFRQQQIAVGQWFLIGSEV